MINAISEIGKYLIESGDATKEDIIKNLVNQINGDTVKYIFLIDVTNDGLKTSSEEFYNGITTKALFYQAGRGVKGGGIRADYFKDTEAEKKKFISKIESAAKYCEVSQHLEAITEAILNRINEHGNDFFAVLLKDGKYPIDSVSEKFLKDFYTVDFKKIKGNDHTCHLCSSVGEGFNTVTFKFYTNDKDVFGNVNSKEKSGVVICKECLENLILGKKHVEEYLTTYWMGSNVMFIPHSYNEDADITYLNANFNGEEGKKFLDNISSAEVDVLEELGNIDAETDIVFFEKDGAKTFYIYHTIKSLLPSRFSFLAKNLRENHVNLYWLINKLGAVKYGAKGFESTEKERFNLIDKIFSGSKINRNIFFQRMMKHFKEGYYSKDGNGTKIYEINRYYNLLVNCSCLEGGFNYMREYKDYSELFEVNQDYFSTNEKKAWFIVGNAYKKLNWQIKALNRDEDGNIADRTSLDKNFFFSRKFDFKDFITFSNLIDEKMRKYPKIKTTYLESMLSDARELMCNKENKVSTDEAKYLFFWGMDIYFKKEVKENNDNEGENIDG